MSQLVQVGMKISGTCCPNNSYSYTSGAGEHPRQAIPINQPCLMKIQFRSICLEHESHGEFN